MKRNMLKVLYFIAGAAPTEADLEDAEQYYNGKSNVAFRNARYVHKDEAIEAFDIVAGCVPENYAKAALEKGEDALRPTPIVDAAAVPAGSPLAPPPLVDPAVEPPPPPKAPETPPKPPATPKPPAAKPGAGWKPNA